MKKNVRIAALCLAGLLALGGSYLWYSRPMTAQDMFTDFPMEEIEAIRVSKSWLFGVRPVISPDDPIFDDLTGFLKNTTFRRDLATLLTPLRGISTAPGETGIEFNISYATDDDGLKLHFLIDEVLVGYDGKTLRYQVEDAQAWAEEIDAFLTENRLYD